MDNGRGKMPVTASDRTMFAPTNGVTSFVGDGALYVPLVCDLTL